jgi:quercetin dioxygenase-like cupin family protein
MNQTIFFPNWRDKVIFSAPGPQPQVLVEDGPVKVVVVGLEPGGRIPVHPGDFGVYHFLEGAGQMAVENETFAVQAGATVVIPAGAPRGMTAQTRIAFIAVRVAA